MISKILLTLAVIGVALFMLQLRRRPVEAVNVRKKELFFQKWFRVLSVVVISLMVLAAGVFIYIEWHQAREVMQVQVIDNRTGNYKEYKVLRSNLHERSFQTLDGRIVTLAETDRMEVVTVK